MRSLTLIRADKRSVWRDSNEARGFVPLLAHKHYIEHLSNSSYRFIEENYIAIIIVIELSPSPRVNIRKAAGPDGITGRVLRSCADQLAGLFTSIFNKSLATSVVPTSFKKSIIIPVSKNNKPSCLNDYRPVALTSIVMKVFERLVKSHISSSIPVTLDPLQFAYHPNRSIDDAISHILHSSLAMKLCKAAIHRL